MMDSKQDDIQCPPPAKRRRIDVSKSDHLSVNNNVDFARNVNVNFAKNVSSKIPISKEKGEKGEKGEEEAQDDKHRKHRKHGIAGSIMETKEILEHIHSFLNLDEILLSRLVCRFWNNIFKLTIKPSKGQHEFDIFPLYIRQKFEETIGNFEQFLLFFVCEYRNYSFKTKLKLKSTTIYPHYNEYGIFLDNLWHSKYPEITRFDHISKDEKQYKLYQKLITMFLIEIKKTKKINDINNENVSLHNILFSWLRGLKNLSLYWLNNYDTNNLKKDLQQFHKTLSCDYIESENGNSIPLIHSIYLTKFDYLSSFLGLLTLNGDFELFHKFKKKIECDSNNSNNFHLIFSKQHHSNHVYNHIHTFGFGYNSYGLCKHKLFDITLKLCDIPRNICSLKIVRFVIQPHILINIQSDLIKHKYHIDENNGNILNVSLNQRIVTIKKLCFYFDLCATIHSSNLNRSSINEYLIIKELKRPYYGSFDQEQSSSNYSSNEPIIINNYQFWKRYILLSHLIYFITKYKNSFNINNYLKKMLLKKPKEINNCDWIIIENLKEKVNIIYPNLENEILKEENKKNEENEENEENEDGYYLEIESYLKRHFIQYKSAITLLDIIGAIYTNATNRNLLRSIERMGPINIDQYQQLKQCILSSQQIRDFYINKYDIETFYSSIKNISFHDSEININDDNKYKNDPNIDIGLFLKHGSNTL